MTKKFWKQNLLTYLLLIFVSLFALIPIIYMVSTSLKSISEILTAQRATLFPVNATVEGYVNTWTKYPFFTYIKNSIIYFFTLIFQSDFRFCIVFYGGKSLAKYSCSFTIRIFPMHIGNSVIIANNAREFWFYNPIIIFINKTPIPVFSFQS